MKKSTKIIIAVLILQVIIFAVVVRQEWQKPAAGNSVLDGLGVIIAIIATPLIFAAIFGFGTLVEFLSGLFRSDKNQPELEPTVLPAQSEVGEERSTGKTTGSIFGRLFGATLLFWPLLFAVVFGLAFLVSELKESAEQLADRNLSKKASEMGDCLVRNQNFYRVKQTEKKQDGISLVDQEGNEYTLFVAASHDNQSPTLFINVKQVPEFEICDTLAWANYGLALAKPFLADSIYRHLTESVAKGQTNFSCIADYEQFSMQYRTYQAYAPFEFRLSTSRLPDNQNLYLMFNYRNCKRHDCLPNP